MQSVVALAALSGFALVNAQNPPAATPSNAVLVAGDASYDGPVIPGTTGKDGDAQVVSGNPIGATYKATLLDKDTSEVRGYVQAVSGANGQGAQFTVSFSGLPDPSIGPFLYHIHAMPVPSDGNCSGAKAHLDPYMRGAIPPCENGKPETCQVGDVAGKHGNITSDPFTASYFDPYVSLTAGNKASLVGKSIVVHSSNTTRLNCGNFELVSGGGSNSSSGGNGTSTGGNTTTPTSPTPVPFTPSPGAAAMNVVSVGAATVAMVAVFAFLL